jgi:hypothetical protein
MSETQVVEAPATQFSEREQALLIAAMSSLKSGMSLLSHEHCAADVSFQHD